jgi:hypothetical protein
MPQSPQSPDRRATRNSFSAIARCDQQRTLDFVQPRNGRIQSRDLLRLSGI